MRETLDLQDLRQAMSIFAGSLRRHREELDSLNVYPVPDGDTGTNLLLTQEAVVSALESLAPDAAPHEVAAAVARSSLMGARGNSGVILSQILRGLCEGMPPSGRFDGPGLAAGLRAGADQAFRAVSRPAEGTILSVARDAATGAEREARRDSAGCREVLVAAVRDGRSALARTTGRLPELARAGVVDAGGKGFVILLDALLASVTGQGPTEPIGPLGPVGARGDGEPPGPLAFVWEVQYLLEAGDGAVGPLRTALADIGDSLVIVGGTGLFNVHIHTNQPDRAVDLGRRAGHPREVQVTSLQGQVERCASRARAVQASGDVCALVVAADGEGLRRAFRSLGAEVAPEVSVAELASAVEAALPGSVVILAGPDSMAGAGRAARDSSKEVAVVPAASVPAGLAAATAFNPVRKLEENVAAMEEAAARTRAGVVGPGGEPAEAAVAVARELATTDAELITLVVGAGATAEDGRAVEEALHRAFPDLTVEVVDGGQSDGPFLIGVE
jgi:fatty acid kinase